MGRTLQSNDQQPAKRVFIVKPEVEQEKDLAADGLTI
jgi:hypothetical protein